MPNELLLSPPVVFIVIMFAAIFFAYVLSKLAMKPKNVPEGLTKEYSCGEDIKTHMIQPDYSQFFPFAFYFTILHVVALMIATVPMATMQTFLIAVVYILGAIVGLFVLYKR
jgi:ABC-type phosphate/phosphonate transport system permease subunit